MLSSTSQQSTGALVSGYHFPLSQIQKVLESEGRYSWLQADLRLSEAGPISYLDSGLHTQRSVTSPSLLSKRLQLLAAKEHPTRQVLLLGKTIQLVFVLCTTTVVFTRTILLPRISFPSPLHFPVVKYNCEGFEEVPDNIAHSISAHTIPKLP